MSAARLLAHARALGIELSANGEKLHYQAPPGRLTPELRELLKAHKPEILRALETEAQRPLSAPAPSVTCATCRHFDSRPGEQPDGSCRRFRTETWGAVSFTCEAFEPADSAAHALALRRRRVERLLADNGGLRIAADVEDAPLQPGPGNQVSVVLAVRTMTGIVSGELAVPAEKFDAALFFRTLEETGEPS